MSISAVAPTPFPYDPDRLQIEMPNARDEASQEDGRKLSMFAEGDDSPSFWDFLDIINPLQHIPVVNKIYQELTGDKIGVGARLAGGTLFGGPIGLIASAADCALEEGTGEDAGGHVLALFRGDAPATPGEEPATMIAAAPQQPQTQAQAQPQQATPSEPPPVQAAPQQPVQAEKLAQATTPAAAPVIALPEGGRNPSSKGGMAFTLDGQQTAAPASATKATATQGPMPLAQPAKFMPVPARTNVDPNSAPMITVPVSTSQTNSVVPITGRAPNAATTKATAKQGDIPAGHPMLPPTDAQGQTAASPDWFTTAWSQALDKYQKANRRSDPATGTTTDSLN